jgi:predicted RNA-binding Zn ribbon-like protein
LTVTYNTGMVVEVRPADQDWVVAFVNEYGTEPRREADEQEEPYPPMDALGTHDVALSSSLAETQLVSVADGLHRVFASPSRSAAAEALNALLEESSPEPRIRAGGSSDGYEKVWRVDAAASPGAPLKASCALALLDVLCGRWGFGLCEASACVDVFVDRSPGGRRKYCSAQCHTRTKVAAFRERRKRS